MSEQKPVFFKSKISVLITVSILILFVGGIVLWAVLTLNSSVASSSYQLCFIRRDGSGGIEFTTEAYEPSDDISGDLQISQAVLTALLAGPTQSGSTSAFPAGVTVKTFAINRGVASVDLSAEYASASALDMRIADRCLVNTLVGVCGIQRVMITVDGNPHPYFGYMPVSKSDFVSESGAFFAQEVTVTLYLPRTGSDYLGVYSSSFEKSYGADLAESITKFLISGNFGSDFDRVAPSASCLRSVTSYNGTVYIDLSRDFLYEDDSNRQSRLALYVYSIVNSLTELKEIDSVVFTFDGRTEGAIAGMSFSQPFVYNSAIVRKSAN